MSSEDNKLIRQAQLGDDSAFEKLIERYDRHVLSLAFSYTRNSDDTKDIYQETFLRAYRAIRKFKFRSEFSTWLYRIAVNVCLTFRIRQSREARLVDDFQCEREGNGTTAEAPYPSTDNSAEADFMRNEIARNIESALASLSPMQRIVFTMKHYEGYKLREIAVMVGCTEGTAKKHMFNAVRRLQVQLEDLLEES